MAIRVIQSANGAVHDITQVAELSNEPCNLRFLSDKTLYVLQNLSAQEITYYGRYGEILENNLYAPVSQGDENSGTVLDAVNIIRRDLTDMGCNDIVAAINSLGSILTNMACGCPVGQGEDTTAGEEGGDVPPPVGDIVFEEPAFTPNRKCKAANLIHETLKDMFVELDELNIDDYGTLGLVLAVATVTGIITSIAATPMAGLLVGVAGGLAVFVARLIGIEVFNMTDIANAFIDNGEALVCALYDATDVDTARDDYQAVLLGAGLSTGAVNLIGLMMFNAVMDILFFDTADIAVLLPIYTPPFDCASCESSNAFDLRFGSGTITYEGSEFVLTSEPFSGYHKLTFDISDDPCVDGNWCLEFKAHTTTPGFDWYRGVANTENASCDRVVELFPGSFPPLDDPVLVAHASFNSDVEFTVTARIIPEFRGNADGTLPYSGTNDCS